MIPKIIHYCWFGNNPLPESALRCIESWKKHLPDYEIKEWNESNFDVNINQYTKEAYECKKYAFVSDYARFYVLYKYGGLYFDTDVEVIRDMTDIISMGSFMGFEMVRNHLGGVNAGLGMGAVIHHDFIKNILEKYDKLHFIQDDGTPYPKTIVHYTTELLDEYGLIHQNKVQKVAGFTILSTEYLCPLPFGEKKLCTTSKTCSIHWYDSSWKNESKIKKAILNIPLVKPFYRLIIQIIRK